MTITAAELDAAHSDALDEQHRRNNNSGRSDAEQAVQDEAVGFYYPDA